APLALQGDRRQVPPVPLRALDTGSMARAARALRVRAHARLATRAARARSRELQRARSVARARIHPRAASHAPRQRQLHARSGGVGRALSRGMDAVSGADAAARNGFELLRRSLGDPGLEAPGSAAARRAADVPGRDTGLYARGGEDALAAGAGYRQG